MAPTGLTTDGHCPQCGAVVAEDASTTESTSRADGRTPAMRRSQVGVDLRELAGDEAPGPLPWHFKLLVAMLVAYMGWRVVQIFV
jgi:hypothetical protein